MSKVRQKTLSVDNLPHWLHPYPGAEDSGWYLAPRHRDIWAPHPTQDGRLFCLPFSPRDKFLTTEDGDQDWGAAVEYNAIEAAIDIGLLDIGLDGELAKLLAEDTEQTEH